MIVLHHQRREAHGLHPVGSSCSGMTLLEVVLAMAIFVGSLAVMSQLVWNGSRAAVQSQLQTQALVRCEAMIAEIVVGATPLQAGNGTYTDNTNWSWSVVTEQTQFPELVVVEVTVLHTAGSSMGNVTQKLRRWMRDPAVFQAALEAQQAAAAEETSTGTGTTTQGGGTR